MKISLAQIGKGFGDTSTPLTPTLSIATGDGSVTATIAGDAGITHYLLYKTSGDSAWQSGGSRSGDGDIEVTGLANDSPYVFIVYSQTAAGLVSLPAIAKFATLAAATENDFDEVVAEDVSDFLDTFGEDITYLPRGGGSRAIVAIVNRDGINQRMPGSGTPAITITVANSSTIGISSAEFDSGGDKVSLAPREGDDAKSIRITKIISHDPGMMTLEVR